MRDLIVLLVVFGILPFVLTRPYVGILLWSWLGYMNPHRLAWGFAYDFPFAQLAAVATLIALPFDKTRRSIPFTPLIFFWVAFIGWMNLSTIYALNASSAHGEWDRMMKIMLFSFITIILMQDRKRINYLVIVIVVSLGFYGVKGGIFSILTGGNYLVFGPADSFFEDNNALALALIMTLPLLRYLHLQAQRRSIQFALIAAMLVIGLAILTSHSRGALIAGIAMMIFLWMKGENKIWTGVVIIACLPILIFQMPDEWFERMGTISSYEEDGSAMGRINAWWFAFNLARAHPLVGGGFNTFTPQLFARYAPEPFDFHDAHSIYFEVLGEHGFVGLALFLSLGLLSLRGASWVIKRSSTRADLAWARDLAAMIQVSLVGYAVGGTFLGLAYFDLYYHLIAMLVILRAVVTRELRLGVESEFSEGQRKPLQVSQSNMSKTSS